MMTGTEIVEVRSTMSISELFGYSPSFMAVLESVTTVAPTNCAVLIPCETGTGKEVIQAIQDASPRRQQSFVAINCAAIPAALLESELFGHERGAFASGFRDNGKRSKKEAEEHWRWCLRPAKTGTPRPILCGELTHNQGSDIQACQH